MRELTEKAAIEGKNIVKDFQLGDTRTRVLKSISLKVSQGEFVSIMGQSGSGKSTLLYILGGLDTPTSGAVFMNGIDISKLGDEKMSRIRRQNIGFVFQFYNLIPTLSVKKNICLPMLLDNKEPGKERFDDIVRTLGLGDRLEHLPGQLSGGQQQRAAIGRALIYQPAILLADEPTGNLDRKNTEEIISLLKLSNRQYKQTILLVTHDENVALEADRIIKIEDGKIISDKAVRP